MGLDNIPYNYPCKVGGTAVMVNMKNRETGEDYIDEEGNTVPQIDCKATQECGGCTWKQDLGNLEGAVKGIFGTDCWYRGKYGAYLLSITEVDDTPLWGDVDGHVSASECHGMADEMEERLAGSQAVVSIRDGETEDVTTEYVYFAKWLRWVADKCGGSTAWF